MYELNTKKSFVEVVVTQPTTDFTIGFEFDEGADVYHVLVDGVPADEAGYTTKLKNSAIVELTPAVPNGTVRIYRETDIDSNLYKFTAGALFEAHTMDANFNQILHSQQETRDGFDKLAGDVYPLVNGLEVALEKADEASKAAQEAADAAEEATQVTRSASKVNDASGETQQQVNYNGGSKWHSRVGGYKANERVVLANGDIVKSTIPNNTANPNVDMTGWVNTADASQIVFKRSGLATTIRTLMSMLQDVVSVKDFGAVGDGVTDDSAAINAAFNSGAGNVIFPFAAYYIAENITPKSNTVIYGCQSTIKYENQTSVLLIIDVARVTIYDLVVDGNYLNWTSDQAYTVGIYRSKDISILNCEIKNGVHAGIGIGQTNEGNIPNERILIDNCYIHHIGTPSLEIAYGNGVAVICGNDVIIRNNNISDIHHVGAINIEGLEHDNIQIIGNRISRTTGIAAGIKIYASGVDAPANNVIIRDNILTNLSVDMAVNAEPAIWIQAGGRNVSILNNIIDGVNSQGIVIQSAGNLTLTGNTIRAFTKTPLMVNTTSASMKVSNNLITYPLGSSADPVFIETSGSLQSIADITGNTVEHAPREAFILNARSPLRFTGNTIVNCRSNGTFGYAINYLAASYSNCIIGENIIRDTLGSVGTRFVAFYNFSGNHPDLVYLPDAWSVTESIPKFDLGANTSFIQSSVALKSAPPTTGYNERGRILYNADPAANAVTGWICTVSGTSGTWKAFGQLV